MLALTNTSDLLALLGARMAGKRLGMNWTQSELSMRSGVPLGTLRKLESTGFGSMEAYIKLLRALGALTDLEHIISQPAVSPVEMARLKNRQRVRASRQGARARIKHVF
jgi:transcriptional regulator with XRE-family HTH domain